MTSNAAAITTNDKRETFGWAMYDWANSAFSTTVGTVFLGPYLASLATEAAKAYPDGMARLGGIPIAPDSFLPYCVSFSVGMQVLFLPILGAIADYSHMRKQMMQLFATIGAVATILLFFVAGNLWWLGGLLFILANLTFGAAAWFSTTPTCPISPARTNATTSHPTAGRWATWAADCCCCST